MRKWIEKANKLLGGHRKQGDHLTSPSVVDHPASGFGSMPASLAVALDYATEVRNAAADREQIKALLQRIQTNASVNLDTEASEKLIPVATPVVLSAQDVSSGAEEKPMTKIVSFPGVTRDPHQDARDALSLLGKRLHAAEEASAAQLAEATELIEGLKGEVRVSELRANKLEERVASANLDIQALTSTLGRNERRLSRSSRRNVRVLKVARSRLTRVSRWKRTAVIEALLLAGLLAAFATAYLEHWIKITTF